MNDHGFSRAEEQEAAFRELDPTWPHSPGPQEAPE